jgi:hypothetical protein
MKRPPPELNPIDMFLSLYRHGLAGRYKEPVAGVVARSSGPAFWENRARKIVVFVMDVLRPLPYLAGLLNRMDIKAIAASPSFAMRTRNHEAWETPRNSGVA